MMAEPTAVEKLSDQQDPEHDLNWLWNDGSPEAAGAWIEEYLTIPDVQGRIVPFKLFPQQWEMLHNMTGRDITVKGRQTRASSLFLAYRVRKICTSFGFRTLIAANDEQTTGLFRSRIKHHFRDLERKGYKFKTDLDNDDELVLNGLDSVVIYQSGEKRVVGRSFSVQSALISELAHWKPQQADELLGGLKPAVPGPPHGAFDLESTPKGADGIFYEEVQDSKSYNPDSLWTTHCYPWWMEPRYRIGSDLDADIILPESDLQNRLAAFRPTPEEENLMAQHGLVPEQVIWRRLKKADLVKTGVPFEQEYPESLDACFIVGVAGNYFTSLDGIDHLGYYRNICRDPITLTERLRYNGAEISFQDAKLHIWEFPQAANTYVGFLDCSSGEGGPRTDYSALAILNVQTRTVAARLRVKVTPTEAGKIACAVGQYYNTALMGVERGGYGSQAVQTMREMEYPNLYYHVGPAQMGKGAEIKAGIYPTEQNREAILQSLRDSVFDHSFVTFDKTMVQEMSTFDWVRVRDRMKQMARTKASHDDLVVAAAGAIYILPHALSLRRRNQGKNNEEIVIGQFGQVIRRGRVPASQKPWLR